MKSLEPYNDLTVDKAYIITIKDNDLSEQLSQRCQHSCHQVDQPCQVWPAFDGTSGQLIIPESLQNQSWLKWIKLYNTDLSVTEVACFLSHISLWAHCLEINMPIVILEHDAIMVKPYPNHLSLNQLVYLGCIEQAQNNSMVSACPLFGTLPRNTHWKYILRTHAYAIDPMMAKRLLAHVIDNGISDELAEAIRADIFNIIQVGLYAYDQAMYDNGKILTTITDTKEKRYGQ